MLEQGSASPPHRTSLLHARIAEIEAQHPDAAAALGDQTEQRAQENRLPGARRADDAQNLAAIDVQREIVEHRPTIEGDGEVANLNDWLVRRGVHRYILIAEKNIAKIRRAR